jgi:outer membrane cobalamin receptor
LNLLKTTAFFLGILAATSGALAQTSPDTLSRQAADTVATADSIRTTFIPDLGTFSKEDTTHLSASRFIWTDALSLEDLLNFSPGILLRRLGSAGQPDMVSIGGIDWRGAAILLDGRPMNDPVTGVENLYDIPLEFVDHIELSKGPKSFLYAQNGSAATLNVVTRQYNTGRPVTKVRFMQGPSEHLLTDALFAQNITRQLNLTLGVQRQVTDGRFFNSAYDSWAVRSRLRYNASEKLNISLMDFYRRSVTGFNNGVLFDSTRALGVDPFNEAEAAVASRQASQTSTRRDVTLNAIAAIFPDSTWTTKAVLYYSTAERAYHDSLAAGAFEQFSWSITGATLRQDVNMNPLSFQIGGQVESREASLVLPSVDLKKKYAAWFGSLSFHPVEIIETAGFVRGEAYAEGRSFSYGGSIKTRLAGILELEAAYSRFARFPSLQESSWGLYRSFAAGPIDLLERHTLAELTGSLNANAFTISASVSRRTVTNALLFVPLSASSPSPLVIEISPELSILQFSGAAQLRLWVFDASGSVTYTEARNQDVPSLLSPKFILTGELVYRDDLLDGALKTRLGLRSRYLGRHNGVRFYPSFMVYAENAARSISPFSTLDLFGVFKIGDAFVNLTWGNVLDKNYLTVYPYPELGRHIRISINWIFLD